MATITYQGRLIVLWSTSSAGTAEKNVVRVSNPAVGRMDVGFDFVKGHWRARLFDAPNAVGVDGRPLLVGERVRLQEGMCLTLGGLGVQETEVLQVQSVAPPGLLFRSTSCDTQGGALGASFAIALGNSAMDYRSPYHGWRSHLQHHSHAGAYTLTLNELGGKSFRVELIVGQSIEWLGVEYSVQSDRGVEETVLHSRARLRYSFEENSLAGASRKIVLQVLPAQGDSPLASPFSVTGRLMQLLWALVWRLGQQGQSVDPGAFSCHELLDDLRVNNRQHLYELLNSLKAWFQAIPGLLQPEQLVNSLNDPEGVMLYCLQGVLVEPINEALASQLNSRSDESWLSSKVGG